MFKNVNYDVNIPPNFVNSILTNSSLYAMFKDNFQENKDYFQNIDREEYLSRMLDFISDRLFSSNVFSLYDEPDDLDEVTKGKLSFIRNFYDDFLLGAFKEDPSSVLKIRLFRGLEFAKEKDIYASKTKEFMDLYEYIFSGPLDYLGIVQVLIKEPLRVLKSREALSFRDFDILCNYVKNNIKGFVDMNIVMDMLHNHAYKKNHIFDFDVARALTTSVIKSYLSTYDIECEVKYEDGLESGLRSEASMSDRVIYIDNSLIEDFCSLNYIELFSHAFYEADFLKDAVLLERDNVDYPTLNSIMSLISLKVDLDAIFKDSEYLPYEYTSDLEASSFIKTLRFFSSCGVNVLDNYIEAKARLYDIELGSESLLFSKKEISLDQRFSKAFKEIENRASIISKHAALKVLYKESGERKSTIELIKMIPKSSYREFLEEYLHSRIISPEEMIEDVKELSNYKSKDDSVKTLIEKELKYIYVDSFYYSLSSYLKLLKESEKESYLEDILLKINCLKDTPLTHKFIDEALMTTMNEQNS